MKSAGEWQVDMPHCGACVRFMRQRAPNAHQGMCAVRCNRATLNHQNRLCDVRTPAGDGLMFAPIIRAPGGRP